MALNSRKEFAEKAGMDPNALRVYIQRKKVVEKGDMIDDADPINVVFLQKRAAKQATKPSADKPSKPSKEKAAAATKKPAKAEPNPLVELQAKKQRLELEKLEMEMMHAKLRMDKQQGLVVPIEVVKLLFAQHFKGVYLSFENAFDNLLMGIAAKMNMSSKDVAATRSLLLKDMNQAIKTAVDSSKKSIEALVLEYSDQRGRGERR